MYSIVDCFQVYKLLVPSVNRELGSIAFLVARPSFSMPRQKGSYRLCEISDVRALYISDVSLDVRRLKKSVKVSDGVFFINEVHETYSRALPCLKFGKCQGFQHK